MTLKIDHVSLNFPKSYGLASGTLSTTWSELLWAAITIGRPSAYHIFRFGPPSFHEAIFRLALIRLVVEQDAKGYLRRTEAYAALDPTEKGMVSYFLGMSLCKLFACKLLSTPWLLHLDVFRPVLDPKVLGRSRPDLVGQDARGRWHAFESKGRTSPPSIGDKNNAKGQAQRLISVNRRKCSLHVGVMTYFGAKTLRFYWRDPEPDDAEAIGLPEPSAEWRYYFEPALAFSTEGDIASFPFERALTDVAVHIHPKILRYLEEGAWLDAKRTAQAMGEALQAEGYQPDGIKVTAGPSWGPAEEPHREH